MLQLITAIIKPHRLTHVREALADAGVEGLTVSEVQGFGRQGGHTESYRGSEYAVEFVPKLKIEVLVASENEPAVIDAITSAAGSGQIGDGKIWSVGVDRAVRIRTGEFGAAAL